MSKKQNNPQEQKANTSQTRKPFTEPSVTPIKPKFIEPKLEKYETVSGLTFQSAFSPPPQD